jgi:UDP-glucose 4-epimerase
VNVLVTGGAGYIGSHAVRHLAEVGHDVWVYDNLCYGHRQAVPTGRLIEGELMDRGKLVESLRTHKIDAVMHFAAFAFVGESVADPAKYYQNNVVASLNLLEAIREAGVAKIVF